MAPSAPLCLIADVDAAHASALAEFCDGLGFRVECVAPDAVGDLAVGGATSAPDVAFVDAALGVDELRRLAGGLLADAELFAMAAEDDTVLAEACIRAGYSFFFRKPFSADSLAALLSDIAAEARAPQDPGDAAEGGSMVQFGLLRGSSRGMRKLFRLLRKVGPSDASVLIVGESGTGKELVAETLHQISERAAAPYVTVNCAAIADTLIESELFGHEKGSFSGALRQHQGFFERAHGGTLFLDEITEMSLDLQAKLLRVLESGELRRVGATQTQPVDVRIVAATNRDPQRAVAEEQLREDLYYRLAHVTALLPPLRRRGEDIRGLAEHFLRQLNEQHGTGIRFTADALAAIDEQAWPGNVRQLRHAVERAYILAEDEIAASDLELDATDEAIAVAADIPIAFGMSLADAERRIILANLEHYGGDKKDVAERLGVSLKTLYNRLRDYGDGDADGR
ncbi:MAG: sigma-54 dependent transcriptional regulator [Halieaceae bacterium]|jgi:DNA-binding NtrC family response regulator|nr:sigma-54 dependent transcriptional regulator [Halieaceae bacterium]